MAKPPRMTAPKIKPMAKPAAKTMSPSAVLGRAERIQKMEAGESRLARSMPPKNKPATPMMSPAASAAARAALGRAERIQREEAGESMLVGKKPQVIRTTVNERTTPAKKK